ncbi:PHD-finger domain-containing protein [Phthorimaea operculella]|nr:PHD-finger domain-containing protein [Phthorimaea operculella]
MNCGVCNNEIARNSLLVCAKCRGFYHYQCLGITAEDYKANIDELKFQSWVCPHCTNVTCRQKVGDNTENNLANSSRLGITDMSYEDSILNDDENSVILANSKAIPAKTSQPATQPAPVLTLNQIAALLDDKNDKFEAKLEEKLGKLRAEIANDFREEIKSTIDNLKKEFTETTDFLSDRIDILRKTVNESHKKITDLEADNNSLRAELKSLNNQDNGLTEAKKSMELISQLQDDINDREQQSLLNDIEITGIPEFNGESVVHVVLLASRKLQVNLEENEIVSAMRVGPKTLDKDTADTISRPRPIVVQFTRRTRRDELIKSSRVRRNATTADLDLPSHQPRNFYVNERLTKRNRVLFAKAREAARDAQWKFVWTKYGRIYARRSDSKESPVVSLRNETDIPRIFGTVRRDNNV